MASFVVYSYQFSPLTEERMLSLFSEDEIDSNQVWKNKQALFRDWFKKDLHFKHRQSTFDHELIYDENGLIVFKLANNKHIVQESGFVAKKLDHKPSCIVLIDNRINVQNIYIEKDDYSFSDTDVVRNILEDTFNSYLKGLRLHIEIKKRYKASEFWEIVESAESGIGMVRFCYQYPNLPDVQAKIDKVLSNASREVCSKQTQIEFNAGHGESLHLSKDNKNLNDLVEASSETGNEITFKINGISKYRKVGDTVEMVEIDNIEMSLSSDLLQTRSQKLLKIINMFKH